MADHIKAAFERPAFALRVVSALIAAAVLAGCTSATGGSGARTTSAAPTTSVNGSFPATTASTSTSASGSARPASPPTCTSDIRVIPGTTQGAAGHIALVLVFNNVSTTTTCEIIGYPGVDLVTTPGATVTHLTRTLRGMAGGEPAGVTAPQAVVVAPGGSASALAEASDVPQGGITNCGSFGLLITVPNQYTSVSGGTSMLPQCAAEIHPVVPGTTGGLN